MANGTRSTPYRQCPGSYLPKVTEDHKHLHQHQDQNTYIQRDATYCVRRMRKPGGWDWYMWLTQAANQHIGMQQMWV